MPFLAQRAACFDNFLFFMASRAAPVFLEEEGRIDLPRGDVTAMSSAKGLPLKEGI